MDLQPSPSQRLSLVRAQQHSAGDARPQIGELTAAISTAIVRLFRTHTGRGPTKAKTILSDELIVVALAECLTTAEKQLAGAGHVELVLEVRRALHEGMRGDATALVEELTGRKVIAYLTDQELFPDLASVTFALASTTPEGA
ncbi:MAG TPA: DUF2294 domain-containing protein [Thermoleophilaceae bacterium]|jgi:uncharacterized protein YbcI|nr:DUF2294 domain-containing protein [Thermoleophilaceae bacterium]